MLPNTIKQQMKQCYEKQGMALQKINTEVCLQLYAVLVQLPTQIHCFILFSSKIRCPPH